jgi:hypothetical protein
MKMSMEKKLVIKKTKELIELLDFFKGITKPIFSREECPFTINHYELSQATGGLGCWKWNCPLCGASYSE